MDTAARAPTAPGRLPAATPGAGPGRPAGGASVPVPRRPGSGRPMPGPSPPGGDRRHGAPDPVDRAGGRRPARAGAGSRCRRRRCPTALAGAGLPAFPPGVAAKLGWLRLPADRPRTGPTVLRGPGAGRPLLPPRPGGPVRPRAGAGHGRRPGDEVRRCLDRIREVEADGRPGAARDPPPRADRGPRPTWWQAAAADALGPRPGRPGGQPTGAGRRAGAPPGQAGQVQARPPGRAAAGRGRRVPTPPTTRVRHGWRIGRRWTDPVAPVAPVGGHRGRRAGRRPSTGSTAGSPSPAGTAGGGQAAGPATPSSASRTPSSRSRYVGRSVAAYLGRRAARSHGHLRVVRAPLGQPGPADPATRSPDGPRRARAPDRTPGRFR